jgi:hypothetical protein
MHDDAEKKIRPELHRICIQDCVAGIFKHTLIMALPVADKISNYA